MVTGTGQGEPQQGLQQPGVLLPPTLPGPIHVYRMGRYTTHHMYIYIHNIIVTGSGHGESQQGLQQPGAQGVTLIYVYDGGYTYNKVYVYTYKHIYTHIYIYVYT